MSSEVETTKNSVDQVELVSNQPDEDLPVGVLDTKPVDDPGLEHDDPRYTDVNQKAWNRAANSIIFMFLLAGLASIAFVVVYFAVPATMTIKISDTMQFQAQTVLFGLTLGGALLLLGAGAVNWARQLMSEHEGVDQRHPMHSSPQEIKTVHEEIKEGITESGFPRRKMLLGAFVAGAGALLAPAIISLADLGPWPIKSTREQTLEKTIWSEGIRLVNDVTFEPIRAEDMRIGELVNGEPDNLTDYHGFEQNVERAKAAIVIVRMEPSTIIIPESRRSWQVDGILAYSKICTHVGCPISLWEDQTHHLLCPCHQSTFDLGDSGVVVFGPAGHALPQLPISVDSQGYLVARSDFTVPVGPSYFERDSTRDFQKGDN